jgi:Cyclic nucleotide-binding domain
MARCAGPLWARALVAVDATAHVPVVEIALLRSLRIFRALPAPALECLARSLEPVRPVAGEVLIREGEPGDRFHAVADGRLQVTIGGTPVATNMRGDCIGEIALLYGVPRTATVTAASPAAMFAPLSRAAFLAAVAATRPPPRRPPLSPMSGSSRTAPTNRQRPTTPARQRLDIACARANLQPADTFRAQEADHSIGLDRDRGGSSDDQHPAVAPKPDRGWSLGQASRGRIPRRRHEVSRGTSPMTGRLPIDTPGPRALSWPQDT